MSYRDNFDDISLTGRWTPPQDDTPQSPSGSGQTGPDDYELKFCPIHGTMTNHKNGACMKTPDVPGDHGTESDELAFWESMFGNAAAARAGDYTILYMDFIERLRCYSHHQTADTLERLKEKAEGDPAIWIGTDAVEAELERIRRQA